MLLIEDNRVGSVGITKLIDLGLVSRANGEPILVGVGVDLLAFVEEPRHTVAKHITAEIHSQLLVQIDVIAVLFQAFYRWCVGRLRGESLGRVGAVGGPRRRRQGQLIGNGR